MPEGDVDASTLASAGVNDAACLGPVSLSPTNVHPGDNVFAVELHQRNASNNNDGTFGARLDAVVLTNSPAAAGLVLNEILASNASLAAADGSPPDWIELHNPSDAGVDLAAMSARSFGADTPVTVEEFRSGLGLPNPYPLVGPVVISEIMYHPPDAGTNDNVIEEFVELHNSSPAAVPLFDPAYPTHTWRLRDAVDFEFAMNTWILPGSYLLAVSFDPTTNAAPLTAFQTRYGSNAALVGPYRGKLDNSDENVELYRPDTPRLLPGPDFGSVPYVLVERVHYHDRGLWPANADGLGPSLQRSSVGGYANDATNWFAAAATPGGNGSLDADGDLMPDDWELAYGLNPSDPTDAVRDDDGDGQSNRDEFLSGTNPRLRASVLRFETIVSAEGLVTIRFEAMAGHAYAVEWRSSPDSGEWARLAFVAAPASAVKVSILDPAVAGFSQRFYRIITPAWP